MARLPPELKQHWESFAAGKMTFDEFAAIAKEYNVSVAMYNEENERRPSYPEGDNRNRTNFTYSPKNKKWHSMQRIMKPAIIGVINKIHAWIVGDWDKDAFVYDDPRMQTLDDCVSGFIDTYFDHQDRKLDMMHKMSDVAFFIMKEDIYYAARIFHLLNNLPYFVLTTHEYDNIHTFVRGVELVDMFSHEPVYCEANSYLVDGKIRA